MLENNKKTEYMYKYMIGFLFLNFAIYSDIQFRMSGTILKYFKYIRFISLIVIIYIASLDISSGILLSVSFVFFVNIINIKKYLRELFTNYKVTQEENQKSFKLTQKEIQDIHGHCKNINWKDEICSTIKKNIKNVCAQNDPLKKIIVDKQKNIILDCPTIFNTI